MSEEENTNRNICSLYLAQAPLGPHHKDDDCNTKIHTALRASILPKVM